MKISKNPTYCNCCLPSGPFDFYGQCAVFYGPPSNDLFWRSPSVIPAGETIGSYLSTDEGWFVDYDPGGTDDEGAIRTTIAVMRTDMEKCWAARNGNLDHPEALYSGELISSSLDGWDVGDDGEYRADGRLVSLDDTAATALAYIKTSVPLDHDYAYVMEVTAKADQVDRLRVSISNVVGSSEVSFVANLTAHTGGDEIDVAGDGFYTYRKFFTTDTPAGGSEFEIRLVDGGGTTIEVADAGDGAYVATASLKRIEHEGGAAGWDVSRIDGEAKTVDYGLVYVRRRRVDPTNHRAYPTLIEEQLVSGGMPSRRCGQVRAIDVPDTLPSIESWREEHFAISRAWVSSTAAGFVSLGGFSEDRYAVDAIVTYGASSLGELKWGFTNLYLVEAPIFCEGDVEDHSPAYYKLPAAFYNAAPLLPRIAGCPLHCYPNVFSVDLSPNVWRDSQIDEWPPEEGDDLPAQFHAETHSLEQNVSILFGPIIRTLYPVTEHCEIGAEDLPFLKGSGSVFWTDSFTQNRLWYWGIGGLGGGSPTAPDVSPRTVERHNWINLVLADAYGSDVSSAGAIWVYTEATYAIYGDSPYHRPYGGVGTISPWEEITGYAHTLYLKLGGGTPISHPIWRDAQAFPNAVGNELWFSGLAAVQETEAAQEVAVRWVWFERLWETAPTELTPGVGRGWRMHVADAAGDDLWTLESDQDAQVPDCVATSDRFLYVVDFELCDSRMAPTGGRQTSSEWSMSHDGSVMWPTRQVSVITGDDSRFALVNATPGTGNGNSPVDSIKNSDRLPLVPALGDWPD